MINEDEVFDAVADRRRRQLLVELVTRNPVSVPELSGVSRAIAEADGELLQKHLSNSREIPEANEELLSLYHVHLPKLADYGFIEWDRDSHLVTKGPRFDELRPLLELLIDHRDDPKTSSGVLLRR